MIADHGPGNNSLIFPHFLRGRTSIVALRRGRRPSYPLVRLALGEVVDCAEMDFFRDLRTTGGQLG